MKTPRAGVSQPKSEMTKSPIKKHSVMIAGHNTSLSLEEPFWRLLKSVAAREGVSTSALIARIDGSRKGTNLSSAIRIHLIEWLMAEGQISLE